MLSLHDKLPRFAQPAFKSRISNPWSNWVVCVLLALAVWAVFGQTLHHDFVNYDDDRYVYDNAVIKRGLSWDGVAWAFTHTHGDNWHPLTSISHMLDCQLYGLKPNGHHLTNVLIHAANSILLFLLLRGITGALWQSAFVAAVFAIHPLRVESVAWVSERKDVLSGLFFLLTLRAYARYVKSAKAKPLSSGFYWLSLLFFCLGLMSKPMLVTTPFVLLLVDYWPLGRFTIGSVQKEIGCLLWEKIPFFALSAGSCVATMWAQSGAIQTSQVVGWPARISNAVISTASYLWQMIYPIGLAPFYPHTGSDVLYWEMGLSLVALVVISCAIFFWWRNLPYLSVGWLWYLGMLVPVIGLVQVGAQARADRYTYLPQIGLYIAAAWGATNWCSRWRQGSMLLKLASLVVIGSLMVCAYVQTSYWKNSATLWSHALVCGVESHVAHLNLGMALADQGKLDEAIAHWQRTLQLDPNNAEAHNNLGNALLKLGRLDEAENHCLRALELKPDYAETHSNLGIILAKQGRLDEAIAHWRRALELNPDFVQLHYNIGTALLSQGKLDEAAEHYQRALQLKPDYAAAWCNLGMALALQGKTIEARGCLERALKLASAQNDQPLMQILRTQLGKLPEAQ